MDKDEDAEWECTDLLGKGAFGMVGKWRRFNKDGKVVETLAVKQFDCTQWDEDCDGNPGIPAEAALATNLMHQGCKNVAKVKFMRFFDTSQPKFRLYLEFCEKGTLKDLVRQYQEKGRKADRRVHIPEAFIWQAFWDFADCYYHMATFKLDSALMTTRAPEDYFLLHLDLKDANVLLAEPPPDRLLPYPMLKVADFGMAEYTNRWDPNNSYKWKNNGTICWMPPLYRAPKEQYDANRYGDRWRDRVLGSSTRAYTVKHNLWQMAACIYGLMELTVDNRKLERLMHEAERDERRLKRNGYSILDTYHHRHYSKELCYLVEDCLRIRPQDRPGPDELRHKIKKNLLPYLQRFTKDGTWDRLY
ncbi:hypothetical protein H2200_008130 [Cladophialophora chaetospira]|uniref:non-specific serine/threonine protein kinase n=1 Tax=Cladophialophora chaetospira TaxID=386627 RepID=A0AA39CGB5_9EURO|nr:hypothetical protein H2200_008130 [Cladophialophora chaetospira]